MLIGHLRPQDQVLLPDTLHVRRYPYEIRETANWDVDKEVMGYPARYSSYLDRTRLTPGCNYPGDAAEG